MKYLSKYIDPCIFFEGKFPLPTDINSKRKELLLEFDLEATDRLSFGGKKFDKNSILLFFENFQDNYSFYEVIEKNDFCKYLLKHRILPKTGNLGSIYEDKDLALFIKPWLNDTLYVISNKWFFRKDFRLVKSKELDRIESVLNSSTIRGYFNDYLNKVKSMLHDHIDDLIAKYKYIELKKGFKNSFPEFGTDFSMLKYNFIRGVLQDDNYLRLYDNLIQKISQKVGKAENTIHLPFSGIVNLYVFKINHIYDEDPTNFYGINLSQISQLFNLTITLFLGYIIAFLSFFRYILYLIFAYIVFNSYKSCVIDKPQDKMRKVVTSEYYSKKTNTLSLYINNMNLDYLSPYLLHNRILEFKKYFPKRDTFNLQASFAVARKDSFKIDEYVKWDFDLIVVKNKSNSKDYKTEFKFLYKPKEQEFLNSEMTLSAICKNKCEINGGILINTKPSYFTVKDLSAENPKIRYSNRNNTIITVDAKLIRNKFVLKDTSYNFYISKYLNDFMLLHNFKIIGKGKLAIEKNRSSYIFTRSREKLYKKYGAKADTINYETLPGRDTSEFVVALENIEGNKLFYHYTKTNKPQLLTITTENLRTSRYINLKNYSTIKE